MKFQPDTTQGPTITGYGPGWVAVNGERHASSLVVNSQTGSSLWPCIGYEDLRAAHFDIFLPMEPELVLFGSGGRIRFPQPEWLQSLFSKRIGVETMDTYAACRTYNFLAGEGRRVIAALLV
jgi:uncharacterized protein